MPSNFRNNYSGNCSLSSSTAIHSPIIMTTPNLDATWHQWVESLAIFMFSIEYQEGCNNAATDVLSWVTSKLDTETMKSILDGVTMGRIERANANDQAVAKAEKEMQKPVQEPVILAFTALVDLHVTDWVTAPQKDPILMTVIEWISGQEVHNLKHLLGDDTNTEEGKAVLQKWKKLTLSQGTLYHCHTPTGKLEEVLQFIVPKAHWVAAMNGCHQDAVHQDQQQTLCLLHDWSWWPGIAAWMQKVSWEWCIQHEGTHAKAPMWPIIVTAPLALLHIGFTRMELDQSPNVVNILVFCDHFTKHVMCMWPPTKLHKLLLSFCGKVISLSLEHYPCSWVPKEPTLKETSSETFVSLWDMEGVDFTLPCSSQWTGGMSSPTADEHDREIK